MLHISNDLNAYLKELNKKELGEMVKIYHNLCVVNKVDINKSIEKKKKNDIIKYLLENINNYTRFIIEALDIEDFTYLKELLSLKSRKIEKEDKKFLDYLKKNKLLFGKEELEIPKDVFEALKKLVSEREIIKKVKKQDELYKTAEGIIIAYGVITKEYFLKIVEKIDQDALGILNNYYKKSYEIKDKVVINKALKNPKRIDQYLKNDKQREFTNAEFYKLGSHTYHRGIKSYKKLIRVLKTNYVFKNSDIIYVDKVIVTPFLYKSLNEETEAYKALEETITKLFEFKNDKLKMRMITEIKSIRNDFPLWEYRGYTKNEVN